MTEYIHFIAGGVAGATSAFATCPLEVLKTRLQSTVGQAMVYQVLPLSGGTAAVEATVPSLIFQRYAVLGQYARHIFLSEGVRAFYKGLCPTLFGIMPNKAIYFATYNRAKKLYNGIFTPNSHQVHMASALSAGVVGSTITSPIWVVKTRLQLDSSRGRALTVTGCVRQLVREDGIRGFYRGLSASYAGVSETAICFVLYEHLKKRLQSNKPYYTSDKLDVLECIFASSVSKVVATTLCYPHEVARTRMRQRCNPHNRKYKSFFQTLLRVWREEGRAGLYGGMMAHLMRVIPNTAIMFLTYEAVVRCFDVSH